MPLIDATYFDGDISLVGFNMSSTAAAVDMAIEIHEPDYLDKVLGAGLAEKFLYGLLHPVGGAFSKAFSKAFKTGNIDQRWLWLRDGKVFTLADGRSIRWQGFRNARKQSPLANYVYYRYRVMKITQTTASGEEVSSKGENSNIVTADIKMDRAWNQMVEWNLQLYFILSGARADGNLIYPEYRECDVDGNLFHKKNIFGI